MHNFHNKVVKHQCFRRLNLPVCLSQNRIVIVSISNRIEVFRHHDTRIQSSFGVAGTALVALFEASMNKSETKPDTCLQQKNRASEDTLSD